VRRGYHVRITFHPASAPDGYPDYYWIWLFYDFDRFSTEAAMSDEDLKENYESIIDYLDETNSLLDKINDKLAFFVFLAIVSIVLGILSFFLAIF
jgi:hypothetical protein